jgi:GTPase
LWYRSRFILELGAADTPAPAAALDRVLDLEFPAAAVPAVADLIRFPASRKANRRANKYNLEHVILAAIELGPRAGYDAEESLAELATLARTAGGEVAEVLLQSRTKPDAATLVGSGKVEELAASVKAHDAGVVIFDNELSPSQQRNLEKALDVRVIDRTQLILDIFASRARTREGQMQVELAQLSYLLPRLTGRGASMSRLGGGIGTRGPGETQLETDRRKIKGRIQIIEKGLESVRAGRGIQRRQRQAVPLATIALVGYTNAGKSTLFNRLTGAAVTADARMFATLDPTVRHILLPSHRKTLLSDTVGFIRNLPTSLVKAFRATLEEVVEAQLLLHVVDASSPLAAEHTAHVREVLRELGAGETPQILVLNKADAFGDEAPSDPAGLALRIAGDAGLPAVCVSAMTGAGMNELLAMMDRCLALDPVSPARFRIPISEGGGVLHLLHERARVNRTQYTEDYCEVDAEAPESIQRRLSRYAIPVAS